MPKIIKKGAVARSELIKGADFLADCVKSTLGPFGANFFLEKGNKITNDGVTVAREIELPDEIQNRGITALRQASIKTNDEVGDGTTTAVVLAQAVLKEAVRFLGDESKGIIGKKAPVEVMNQISKECTEIVDILKTKAETVKTKEQLIESARVSVKDETLATLIGGMQWELGKDGIIIAEETNDKNCTIDKVKGIRIDNGFGTSMVINNQEKQSLEVSDVDVLMTNNTFHDFKKIIHIFDGMARLGKRKLVIVGRAFSTECIQLCMDNAKQGNFIYPINAPYTDQDEVMKDMAAILGGTYYHYEDRNLEDMMLSDLGHADKIVARRYDAVITGNGNPEARIAELQAILKGEKSEFMKRNIQQRLAQLTNGFAILKVGANSEMERDYKKDKADDCVNAVRSALQEGVVDGAGLAFKQIAETLPDTYILKRPLQSIYEQIMYSAPKDFKIESWVKDPVKVLRIALQNACTIAGTFATAMGATATEVPKPHKCQNCDIMKPHEEESN